MKFVEYQYQDSSGGPWFFSKVQLGKINLLVGTSASGKSRFLNTLFNLGRAAVQAVIDKTGHWIVKFEIDNKIYKWQFDARKNKEGKVYANQDILSFEKEDGSLEEIFNRTQQKLIYRGQQYKNIRSDIAGISLFGSNSEDKELTKINKGFQTILRRDFFGDGLTKAFGFQSIPSKAQLKNMTLKKMFQEEYGVHLRMYILFHHFKSEFKKVVSDLQSVFPFIENVKVEILEDAPIKGVPALYIKEKGIKDWIMGADLSSGMQKVLLLLLDIYLLPEGGIFLIDEYENSLGINAINFFPDRLNEVNMKGQFIITSHHPYIVNKLPIENWIVFKRSGNTVEVLQGDALKESLGKSKQQQFIQLINHPFYLNEK